MEQAHQPATNNHVNQYERLGTCRSMIPGVGIRPQIFSNLFTDWINLEAIWCRFWENWRQVKMVVLKYLKGLSNRK